MGGHPLIMGSYAADSVLGLSFISDSTIVSLSHFIFTMI